ncbi:MAG: S53 family peptidase [Tumebacillaceae bacterium]
MKKKLVGMVGPLALAALVALPVAATADTTTATTAPNAKLANAVDLGPSAASETITATFVLKIHNEQDLANYIQETVTPGSSHYHKYLSVNQFRSHYAPSNGDINKVIHYLANFGITASAYSDNLVIHATGTVDQFQQALNVAIHDYSKDGKKVHAPKDNVKVPSALADQVLVVTGLDNIASFQSLSTKLNNNANNPEATNTTISAPTPGAKGIPGQLTVGDVADLYNVNGLYAQGITGKGQTIGIATLADFNPQDAYDYWDAVGVKSNTPNRITQVHVDGGGELSEDAGSGETTLDVEQSGGLAPDANVMVYDAPNTDAGFMDVFYQAVSDNKVNTLSVSWGSPEALYMLFDQTNEMQAFHQVFMEAAAQGISTFAAAGDSGAYDTNRSLPYPYFSKVVGTEVPAGDPYITAAGGTTLPTTMHMRHGNVTVSTERAWGWDYLSDYLHKWYGPTAEYDLGYFAVGGGGAVSSYWGTPSYQNGVAGLNVTPAGQSLIDYTGDTPYDYIDLPTGFAGRNVPDISMNADPETGYLVYSDGAWGAEGGTSFVSPQLNGITALMNQYVGSSVGFLNPTMYSLQKSGNAYGANAPFNDITTGTNWYYPAVAGYDTATGIGTPNVSNLAAAIKNQK